MAEQGGISGERLRQFIERIERDAKASAPIYMILNDGQGGLLRAEGLAPGDQVRVYKHALGMS